MVAETDDEADLKFKKQGEGRLPNYSQYLEANRSCFLA